MGQYLVPLPCHTRPAAPSLLTLVLSSTLTYKHQLLHGFLAHGFRLAASRGTCAAAILLLFGPLYSSFVRLCFELVFGRMMYNGLGLRQHHDFTRRQYSCLDVERCLRWHSENFCGPLGAYAMVDLVIEETSDPYLC